MNGEAVRGMKKVLGMMDRAKGELEERLDVAEVKNWRLLVCCVGAELEALIEGEGVLRGALEEAGGDEHVHEGDSENTMPHVDDLDGLENSRHSENGVRLNQLSMSPRRAEEDDEPGPDLLIAHQDIE